MRRPKAVWNATEQCYRTNTGGRTKRFKGIARGDEVGIARAMAEYLAELDREARPPEPLGWDIAIAYCAEARGRKPRTVESHRERLLLFCDYVPPKSAMCLGDLRGPEYRPSHLKGMMAAMAAAGHSPHYVAGVVNSAKAAFAWAASEEGGRLVAANPFGKEVRGPKIPKGVERYADRREVAAFLRFAKGWADARPGPLMRRFARLLLLLVRTSIHTGARPGSLASAWWGDFDPAKGSIVLPADRHKTGTKTGRPLTILLPPTIVRALARERAREGRHPISIFTHKRGRGSADRGADRDAGEPWGEFVTLPNGKPSFDADTRPLCRAVRKIRADAVEEAARRKAAKEPLRGLDLVKDEGDNRFVIYRLRHTYISDGLMGGVASASIAEVTGTSDRMIAHTYGHLLEGHLKTTAEEIHAMRRSKGK